MSDHPPLVLILENDAGSAAALDLLVRDCGYDTLMGSSLAELAGLMQRAQAFVAVIADYHLHDGTGVEAVQRLADGGAAAPVLMMTGTLKGKARAAAILAGHRFLEKPVEPKAIVRWLSEVAPLGAAV